MTARTMIVGLRTRLAKFIAPWLKDEGEEMAEWFIKHDESARCSQARAPIGPCQREALDGAGYSYVCGRRGGHG